VIRVAPICQDRGMAVDPRGRDLKRYLQHRTEALQEAVLQATVPW